jgi:hypothetical protein
MVVILIWAADKNHFACLQEVLQEGIFKIHTHTPTIIPFLFFYFLDAPQFQRGGNTELSLPTQVRAVVFVMAAQIKKYDDHSYSYISHSKHLPIWDSAIKKCTESEAFPSSLMMLLI